MARSDLRSTGRRPLGGPRGRRLGLLLSAALVLAGCATVGAPAPSVGMEASRAGLATVAAEGAPSFAELLREATDHEALFTLAGGLKPMSTGIWSHRFDVAAPDLDVVRTVRARLAPLRTDRWYADVQVFATAWDGQRSVAAYVVHREALARTLERHAWFWAPYGVTPGTHPAEVLAVADRMPRGDRWRAYGHLFGYPDEAVEFFVAAGLAADAADAADAAVDDEDDAGGERTGEGAERRVGPGLDRQFVHVPTWAEPEGRFTYAVPLDHEPTRADRALARAAARIRAAYAPRRGDVIDGRRPLAALRRLDDRFRSLAAPVVAAYERDAGGRPVGPAAAPAPPTAPP